MLNTDLLKQKIEEMRIENNVAGMAVGVTDKDGMIFSSGFGVESVERPILAVRPESLFKIASITKMITGTVIMILCEQGVLELDTPIKNYIPDIKLSRPEAEDVMTLRHILCHGSGLSGAFLTDGPKDERYFEERVKQIFPTLPLESLPGEGKFLYSNFGFVLAAYIAHKVTGRVYSELATELVLKPLGMNRTFYDMGVYSTYPIALPHRQADDGSLEVIHKISSDASRFGSGEIFSNVEDLCKFIRFFLNGGVSDFGERVLGTDSIRQMLSRNIVRGDNDYHGLSVRIKKINGKFLCGHTGSLRPYRASLFFDPEQEVGVVALLNTAKDQVRDMVVETVMDMI